MKKKLELISLILILIFLLTLVLAFYPGSSQLALFCLFGLLLFSIYPLKKLYEWEDHFRHATDSSYINSDHFMPKGQEDLKELFQLLRRLSDEKEQDQEDIKNMSGNLEALINHLTMGMFLVSKTKEILIFSKSLPYYFSEKKGDYKRLEDISRIDVKALVTQVFDQEEIIKKELKGFHDDDLVLEVTGIPIMNQDGSVEQVLILLYDLTTIRNYEKLNMEFISNASHELRTPVTSIKGFAETIKNMPEEEMELKNEFLDIIYNESLRLEHIVEHMLTLSKVKKVQLQKSEIHLNDFLTYTASSMTHQLKEKQLRLDFKLDEDIVIKSDQYMLSQILLNLLTNAIRYTDEDGRITISTHNHKDTVAITIADNGIGINKMELDRIFERFYRVNKGRSRRSGGTGLGLSIVKELSQLLGGKVTVESQLGQGSAFTLTLPK